MEDPSDGCLGDPTLGGALHACGLGDITVPGTKPLGDGRWGHSDLAGDLLEYTADCYAPFPATCKDCSLLFPAGDGAKRSMRGSVYFHAPKHVRGAMRFPEPYFPLWNGIRCARTP